MLAFLQESVALRALALFLAMLSDSLDGFIARRYGKISRVGTFLDPMADKLFVVFILSIFIAENRLNWLEACTMLGRDFAVIIFGCYLAWKGTLSQYQFRAIWCGKITTALQLCVLMGMTFNMHIPSYIYLIFVALGIAALVELYLDRKKLRV